jgi:hypothetical protein
MLLVVERAQGESKLVVLTQNMPRRITAVDRFDAGFSWRCNCGDANQEEIGKL